jgi:hypothetical protein
MKTLKNYSLIVLVLLLISTVSEAQIVLATIKKKNPKEAVATVAATDSTGVKTTTDTKAEEEPAPAATFTLAGSVDVYAHTAFGKVNNDFDTGAPTTSFANLKGFSLGMANLIASYQGEKAGFVADLVFGPRGSDAVFLSGGYRNLANAGSAQIVNQLYTYVKVADVLTFNLGQFNTFVGFEVISPTLNFHYSTSYLFSNGPFNHTGFRADLALENGFVAKLGVMNPTDVLEFNPVNTYTIGGQVGWAGDAGGVWLNVLRGDYDGRLRDKTAINGDFSASGATFQIDLTTGWNIGEKFYLGFNTSMQSTGVGEAKINDEIVDLPGDVSSSFFGAAIYPKFSLSDAFALGLRAEYFSVKDAHVLASPIPVDAEGSGSVVALTFSANYKVGGLTILPEIRLDSPSEPGAYTDIDGELSDSMVSATLAAIYKF